MIELARGDILGSGAEALVNTVNCQGFMGRGIAQQFKRTFPENFRAYEAACKRGAVQAGRMLVFRTGTFTNPRFIINFPTKRTWRGKSRLADIEAGLQSLVVEVSRLGIRSIAVPPLGCGLGGLSWSTVRLRIEAVLGELAGVRVIVFEPMGAPAVGKMAKTKEVPQMTPGRAVLVTLMHRYLGGLMDPFVSLLEVHKLLYFSQEAGEKLRLNFKKATYGPYAENLRHLLLRVEGHFITGYKDGGDDPLKQLTLAPDAIQKARTYLKDHPAARDRFDRVADLVEGFETPFGMELLATVHWVATREGADSADAAVTAVHVWSERKGIFSERQVRLAWDVLSSKGWLQVGSPAHSS